MNHSVLLLWNGRIRSNEEASIPTPKPPRLDGWRIAIVAFDGAPLGATSFAFAVFDLAVHYDAMPGLDLRIVSGEPDAAMI